MTLTRLAGKCKRCPFVDTCTHKQMEILAAIQPGYISTPIITVDATVHELSETKELIDRLQKSMREQIEKDLYKALYMPSCRDGGSL